MKENISFDAIDFYSDSSHLKNLEGFYDSQFENENGNKSSKSEEIKDINNSISYIQNNLNESFDYISDFSRILKTENEEEKKKINLRKIYQYFEELIKISQKAYFRYIQRDENNKINNIFNNCQYIPLIKLEGDKILFHDGNGNGKYFNLKEMIIFYNQLFIRQDEINNNNEITEVFNEGYICKIHNENYFKFCNKCKVNICKNCTINHLDHEIIGSDEIINIKYRFSKRRINTIMKKDIFRLRQNNNKLNNFFEICMKIFYCILMKKIIREKLSIKNKFNYNIEQNILNVYKLVKEKKLKLQRKLKREYLPKYSIIWMTEFYSKKQINDNLKKNKNIWISITSSHFIIIYSFNSLKDKIDNSKDIFELINQKEFNITNPGKIMRLEGSFNPNDKEKNYYLIGSFYNDKAIVISVTHDYNKIEEIQTILNKGLISSIEINIQNKYFLLQSKNNNFNLWYYDYIGNNKDNNNIYDSINDEKGLNYRIINTTFGTEELKVKLINENNKFIIKYSEIISYVITKVLLIVHIFSSEPYLLFYKIKHDEKLNIVNIYLIGELKPRKDQNKFSITHNNSIIIEKKFLIIGAKSNKSNKYGGFYVINIDKIQISYYYQEPNCLYFNSFLNYLNNKFICSASFKNKKFKYYKLILYEFIIDKNEEFKIKKVLFNKGKHSIITNTSIILDSFLVTSSHGTNSLIKINNDNISLFSEYEIDNKYSKNKDSYKGNLEKIIFK